MYLQSAPLCYGSKSPRCQALGNHNDLVTPYHLLKLITGMKLTTSETTKSDWEQDERLLLTILNKIAIHVHLISKA